MSLYSSNGPSSLGSLNLRPFLPVPPLPTFLAEWVSILPLICHLSTYQHDHQLLGQVALLGRISVGLFPRLGVLNGISKLLANGAGFAETASIRGSSSQKVWDVAWGSTFPCANGAASSLIIQWALTQARDEVKVGIEMVAVKRVVNHEPVQGLQESATVEAVEPLLAKDTLFNRQQTLHMLYFTRSRCKTSWYSTIEKSMHSVAFRTLSLVFRLGVTIGFTLFGAYGSGVLLFCGMATKLVSYWLEVFPSQGFLKSNEVHDACMLVATHENASVWYLFTGDRGIVDSLLNKPMVTILPNKNAAVWFNVAHIIQLLSMTFVAAQKGWDAICLLIVLLFTIEWPGSRLRLSAHFCNANEIDIKVKTFKFSGRSPMLGAIQSLSGSQTTFWMDGIIVPCPRRNAWLQMILKSIPERSGWRKHLETLSSFDQDWVLKNEYITRKGAAALKQTLREFKECSAQS